MIKQPINMMNLLGIPLLGLILFAVNGLSLTGILNCRGNEGFFGQERL